MFNNMTEPKELLLFGEVIGPGIQDLAYGLKNKDIYLFDMAFNKQYLSPTESRFYMDRYFPVMNSVPILYHGPFNREKMNELRDGMTTLNNGPHIREGIVITGFSNDFRGNRKIVKLVSPDYLLRKNGTEFN